MPHTAQCTHLSAEKERETRDRESGGVACQRFCQLEHGRLMNYLWLIHIFLSFHAILKCKTESNVASIPARQLWMNCAKK